MSNYRLWGRRHVRFRLVAIIICLILSSSSAFANEVPPAKPPATAASIPDVIKKISPSVVAIIGKPDDSDNPQNSNRFDLMHGTGVIIKQDGWIVTNAHVIKDMKKIIVVTASGKQYPGRAANIDEESDLALVKIEQTGLSAAQIAANPTIQVGETVVAIGTPISFSLRNSVTVGVISGVNRSVHSTYRLLQTDAAINPGNSGGPLVNLKGEVIGINSMKFTSVGIDSLGFAIPSDTVSYVIAHFFAYGKVKRPYLGADLEESWAAVVGLPSNEPLKIVRIDDNSPAARAGLHVGDLVYSVDSVNVTTIVDLNELLKKYLPGKQAKLVVGSDGDLVTRVVTFGESK